MKKFVFIALLGLIYSCQNSNQEGISTDLVNNPLSASAVADTSNLPKLSLKETEFDFGAVSQGDTVKHDFEFINIGKSDLIISGGSGTCGCTVADYPKEPIKPGESGKITLAFDTNGKEGNQRKSVVMVTNSIPNRTEIFIRAKIDKLK